MHFDDRTALNGCFDLQFCGSFRIEDLAQSDKLLRSRHLHHRSSARRISVQKETWTAGTFSVRPGSHRGTPKAGDLPQAGKNYLFRFDEPIFARPRMPEWVLHPDDLSLVVHVDFQSARMAGQPGHQHDASGDGYNESRAGR